jgi:hypothetical protein
METASLHAGIKSFARSLTVILALIAAIASAFSAFYARKANEISRESYIAVQRPFVTAK